MYIWSFSLPMAFDLVVLKGQIKSIGCSLGCIDHVLLDSGAVRPRGLLLSQGPHDSYINVSYRYMSIQ